MLREIDVTRGVPADVALGDRIVFVASSLVLEMGGLDTVRAAFPEDQAELVAAEVERIALGIPAPGPLALVVARRPHDRPHPAGKWASGPVVKRLREALAVCVERGDVAAGKLEGDDRTLPFDAHALRHSVRSILHAEGHDAVTVGAALGHESADSKRRYTHALDGGLARLAADMDRVLAGPEKRKAAEA